MSVNKTMAGLGVAVVLAAGAAQHVQAASRPSPPGPDRLGGHGAKRLWRGPMITGRTIADRAVHPPARLSGTAHKVRFRVLDRRGKAPTADQAEGVYLVPLNGAEPLAVELKDGYAEGSFEPGDYAVATTVGTPEPGGHMSESMVWLAKVHVAKDLSLVLDARKARPVKVSVDRRDARVIGAFAIITQHIPGHDSAVFDVSGQDLYVTPTRPLPGLVYSVQAHLTRDGVTDRSPYVYNLAASAKGVPAEPGLRARTKDLAAVPTWHRTEGRPACGGTYAGVQWKDVGMTASWATRLGALPAPRTEYFTPGFNWSLIEGITTADCDFGDGNLDARFHVEHFPRAGSYTRHRNIAPFGPGAGFFDLRGNAGTFLGVPMLSQYNADSGSAPYAHMTGTSTLRDANGTVVATSDQPGDSRTWARPRPGRYRLTVNAERAAPWSRLAIRQHIVWDFRVRSSELITLTAIGYRTALDNRNRARHSAHQKITLVPQSLSRRVTPSFWVSVDDGRTWRKTAVRASGRQWVAALRNPAAGYVSLRTKIPGIVDQTIIRAYAVQ